MKTLQKKYLAALLLVGLLALLALTPAVRALNVDQKGSITLALPKVEAGDEDGQTKHDAIAATEFTGKLYRVAEVNADYSYRPTTGFEALADENVQSFKDLDAAQIETLTESAAALVNENAAAAAEITFTNGVATAENLDTGLYLLVMDENPFQTADGVWAVTTKPALIPVPVVTGNVNGAWDGSDTYDVKATLKYSAEKALTKIKITKQLNDYSALQGPASFVFRVDAVNAAGVNVFSNVYAMTFTGADTQELIVDNIPVGAAVTVTEVYSGTSYTPDGSGTVLLPATQPTVKNEDGSETIPDDNTAAFVNSYNHRRNYGTTVTNTFSYVENQWQWAQNHSDK